VSVSYLLPDIAPDRIIKELTKLDAKHETYKLTINDHKEIEISCCETAAGEKVVISIVLPHRYPNTAPRIYAEQVVPDAPHRWPDGSLSIFGATAAWNVKTHDAAHALCSYFPAQNSLFPRRTQRASKSEARQAGLGGLESGSRLTASGWASQSFEGERLDDAARPFDPVGDLPGEPLRLADHPTGGR
jgi:hypothetical protein